MRLQLARMVYEDVPGIGPEDVVSLDEAARMLDLNPVAVSRLIEQEDLTMLVDADAPKGWRWRWLLLRSEVEALAGRRGRRRASPSRFGRDHE